MQSPRICVLMPTWNAQQFVAEAVNSILSQSFTDFELVVVDGGSTDQTLEILARYAADARLRVLSAPSPGIVPARASSVAVASTLAYYPLGKKLQSSGSNERGSAPLLSKRDFAERPKSR